MLLFILIPGIIVLIGIIIGVIVYFTRDKGSENQSVIPLPVNPPLPEKKIN